MCDCGEMFCPFRVLSIRCGISGDRGRSIVVRTGRAGRLCAGTSVCRPAVCRHICVPACCVQAHLCTGRLFAGTSVYRPAVCRHICVPHSTAQQSQCLISTRCFVSCCSVYIFKVKFTCWFKESPVETGEWHNVT